MGWAYLICGIKIAFSKSNMQDFLIWLIDRFYFLFRRVMPIKTYRYAVCGGSNLVLDTVLYFIFFHFVFAKENLDLYFVVLSPHIASLFVVFPITFLTGFLLNKYIAFPDSRLPGHIQFFRYLMVGIGALLLSYLCMKLLVDLLGIFPTPARLMTIFITVLYGYILQTTFSFRVET